MFPKLLKNIPLSAFLIIFIAFSVRFIYLDRIPTGISNDEIEFVINAKSSFLNGESLKTPRAEWTHFIVSPIIGPLNLSLLSARLPYALFSVLAVATLYLIVLELFGKKEAFFVGLVASLNPWSIFFGRSSYEAPLAIFFFLLAFYILLKTKSWNILFAFLPMVLGFYSYMGTKLIFLPYVLLITSFSWVIHKKRYFKQYLLLLSFCVIIFASFIISLKYSATKSRLSEVTPDINLVSGEVDTERRLSIETPLTNLFSNKPVILLKGYVSKYLGAFSPDYLFIHGTVAEEKPQLAFWFHGYFYYLDIFFLILGFCILFTKNKLLWKLLLSLILIAPIPSIIFGSQYPSYVLRSSLLFPVFMILIGLGISYFIFFKKHWVYILFASSILFVLYSVQFLNFANIYFFRIPIYNSEAFSLSSRVIARYISLSANQSEEGIVVISPEAGSLFENYLLYTNSYDKKSAQEIVQLFREKKYEHRNVKFVTPCPKNIETLKDKIIIVTQDINCNLKYSSHLTIPHLADGHTLFKILNDKICSRYQLSSYPSDISFSDFSVEKLPEGRFCEKFITNLI